MTTKAKGSYIKLYIADQGPGFIMSTEELNAYSNFTVDHLPGNGLGLRIAKMHEAQLMVGNRVEGGAEIILNLKTFSERA